MKKSRMATQSWCLVCGLLTLSLSGLSSNADEDTDPLKPSDVPWPPVSEKHIKRYTAFRAVDKIHVDGQLTEDTWQQVPRSPRFVDLIRGHETVHDTRAAVAWDDQYLYVAYWVEDPFVTAKFTERDQPIYQDNDVEFFLAFDNAYYEFEINPFGTIYEGLFVWQAQYETAGFSKIPGLNSSVEGVKLRPFNGVGYQEHPRGPRYAFLEWDFPTAKTAVAIDGTVNDNNDRDRGWTVELAFPWLSMKTIALGDDRSIPPKDGDIWRMDFSRFNQFREAPPTKDSQGWAWSHHGCWDSHIPEVFPFITFSTQTVRSAPTSSPK